MYRPRRKVGWIWPKDPQPGNPIKWPFGRRFKDVFSNKGPDIFVGLIDGEQATPHRPRWSRWHQLYGSDGDGDENMLPPIFPCCDRRSKVYDFRTRKYRNPTVHSWSNVAYPDANQAGDIQLVFWDYAGQPYIVPQEPQHHQPF